MSPPPRFFARTPPRVLLVGPESAVQEAMCLLLEGRGCVVRHAATVAGYEAAPTPFDLALLDLYPVTQGGLADVAALRRALRGASGLIVSLVPVLPDEVSEALIASGCNATLQMSALPDRLDAIIAWASAVTRTANVTAPPRTPRGEADR